MFYDIFDDLCKRRGTTPARVRLDLGISQSTMASWKSRQLTPNAGTLQKIADYLYVPVEYLLGLDIEPDSLDMLMNSGKTLAVSLNRLRLAEQKKESPQEIERLQRFSLAVTEDMWDYVSGGLLAAQAGQKSSLNTLLPLLNQLNDTGQKKAIERVEELTEIPRYRAETAPQPSAETKETDTFPPSDGSEGSQEPSEDK